MVMKMLVYARTRFVAFHQWENAPEEYKYLASVHRHEFHIEVGVKVDVSDRGVEFHHLKATLDREIKFIYGKYFNDFGGYIAEPTPIKESCEAIAMRLGSALRSGYQYNVVYVDVSEDGECGGRVVYE